jgi:hypothetical protein
MTAIPEIIRTLNQCRFGEGTSMVQQLLREAAAESPERLTEASRGIVAWKGFFANIKEAEASEPYFRAVFVLLGELAGPDSPAAMAAAENLAGLLGTLDQIEEAIALRERVFAHVQQRFAPDDPRSMNIREGLAFLYRRAGRESAADELNRDTGLCEHLQPVERSLRAQGAKVTYRGQPWSDNCHSWIFLDAMLDCEGLIAGLKLDACVRVHDHRGTHDGSERGLVCTIHNDGVMGPHPSDAGPAVKTIGFPS